MALLNKQDLREDGRLSIYTRSGSKRPIWQARILVPGSEKYRIVSLKTANQQEAIRRAFDEYDRAYFDFKQHGHVGKIPSYRDAVKEYLKSPNVNKNSDYRLNNFSVGYFDNMRIDEITSRHILAYWNYRLTRGATQKWQKQVTPISLLRERSFIGPVFNYAKKMGWVKTIPDLDVPNIKQNAKNPTRDTFSVEEYRIIYRKMRTWVNEVNDSNVKRDRFLIQHFIFMMTNSGCRPGELFRLTFADISILPSGHPVLNIKQAKTGPRKVVMQNGSARYIDRLRELHKSELGDNFSDDRLLFCHKDGTPIITMRYGFHKLLDACGIVKGRRSMYSWRSFYATRRLEANVSPFLVSKNMGTSVALLSAVYGRIVTTDVAEIITQIDQEKKED